MHPAHASPESHPPGQSLLVLWWEWIAVQGGGNMQVWNRAHSACPESVNTQKGLCIQPMGWAGTAAQVFLPFVPLFLLDGTAGWAQAAGRVGTCTSCFWRAKGCADRWEVISASFEQDLLRAPNHHIVSQCLAARWGFLLQMCRRPVNTLILTCAFTWFCCRAQYGVLAGPVLRQRAAVLKLCPVHPHWT